MRTSRFLLIVPLLTTLVVTDVAAEPIFASPPHVVSDGDGQRIVLFLNEPVSGALAMRSGDGFEVRVPRSAVAPAIQGQDYGADGWGNGGDAVKHLVLAAGAKGDTSIRIQPSGPVHGLDAHSVDDPPRLVIELLAAAATKTPHPTKTPGRSPAPVKSAAVTKSAAPKSTHAKSPAATATPRSRATGKPAPTATTVVEPVAVAAAAPARRAVHGGEAVEPPTAEALARATVLTAMAPLDPKTLGTAQEDAGVTRDPGASSAAAASDGASAPARRSSAAPHGVGALPEGAGAASHGPGAPPTTASAGTLAANAARGSSAPSAAARPAASTIGAPTVGESLAAGAGTAAGTGVAAGPPPSASTVAPSAPPAPVAAASVVLPPPPPPAPAVRTGATASFGLRCLWRRFGGVAMCVADPKVAPYVGDHTITALAGALARGKLPEPEDAPTVVTPASTFLAADVLFATRAPDGKLLPVIDAYRRALRTHPDFPEAWRARLNIALAYRAMEFLTELRTTAGEAAVDPTAGMVRGLAGDLAFVTDKIPLAGDDYRRAADIGGLGACLAGRGRARMALVDGNPAAAAAELSALGSLCPPELATDPETVWVRGRVALAQQDFAAARTLLGEAEKGLGKHDQGKVIADLGAVEEAAHDPQAARKTYERLLGGAFGARPARQATVRLAILDGVGGDVTAGLKRLQRLTPEASDPARRSLVMQSARSALARGAAGEALAALHEAHVDPTMLDLADQLVIAEAYRGIGLHGEAERVLAAAAAAAGPTPPDALFAARGALALDRGDSGVALALADAWIRARGRNAGALALKARGAALAGDSLGAHAAVAAAIIEDASLTRALSLDVAEMLRERDPDAALILAREALEPGPTPELPVTRMAEGLALVGSLAEAAGDDDTALAAFTTLTARYGKEPVAADAAYRAARLATKRVPGGDLAAFDEAARGKDPLARRVAGAARDYEAIMKPFAKRDPAARAEP